LVDFRAFGYLYGQGHGLRRKPTGSQPRGHSDQDVVAGIEAGKQVVEAEDLDFGYVLFADGVKVASFTEDRIGYREWARRSGRLD
jgi:hypothetical protein